LEKYLGNKRSLIDSIYTFIELNTSNTSNTSSIIDIFAYDAQTGHQSRRHPATPFRDIFCNTILP